MMEARVPTTPTKGTMLAWFAVLVTLVLLISGCGTNFGTTEDGKQKYRWKMTVTVGSTSTWYLAAEKFAKDLEEETNGRITLKVFGNERLSPVRPPQASNSSWTGRRTSPTTRRSSTRASTRASAPSPPPSSSTPLKKAKRHWRARAVTSTPTICPNTVSTFWASANRECVSSRTPTTRSTPGGPSRSQVPHPRIRSLHRPLPVAGLQPDDDALR